MRDRAGDDLVAVVVAASVVIGPDHARVGERAVSAAARLERDFVHPAELAQPVPHAVHDFEDALDRFLGLERVERLDLRRRGELLVDAWAVLHRARAQAHAVARVVAVSHLGAADVVAQDLGLG